MLGSYVVPFYAALTIISLLVVVFIVNRRQNPAYKLTWSIMILAFPLFGGLMYIAASLQSSTHRFKKKAATAHRAVEPYMRQDPVIIDELKKISRTKAANASYLANKAEFPVYGGTYSVYLPSGEVKFEWLKRELSQAKSFIFLEYFFKSIVWKSTTLFSIARPMTEVFLNSL